MTFKLAVAVPFNVAVNVARTVVAVPVAEAVNIALAWPAATVTLAGTVTVALLLPSATTVPPGGAIPLMDTAQFAVAGPVMVPGLQLRPVTCNCCGESVIPAVAVPFNVAVSVALTTVDVVAAVAVNEAADCPDATITLDGTVTDDLLLASATAWPPLGAAALMVTVQFDVAGPVTDPGLQFKPVTCS